MSNIEFVWKDKTKTEPDDWDDNLSSEVFKAHKLLCFKTINWDYIVDQLNYYTDFIQVFKGGHLAGFAMLVRNDEIKNIQIGIICAQGVGRKLIEQIVDFAREYGYKTVALDAVLHVVPFYLKMGFKVAAWDQNCKETLEMDKITKEVIKKRFESLKESKDDPDISDLLKQVEIEDLRAWGSSTQEIPMEYCVSSSKERKYFIGPRGGKYWIDFTGKKIYVKKH